MSRRRKEYHRDDLIKEELDEILQTEREILHALHPHFPTHVHFSEITMSPTEAGNTQVFTGTLAPAGSAFPSDTVFTVTPNDTALTSAVTVDETGLIVTAVYPTGWVESTTTPLVINYSASSASAGQTLTATITPSAPPAPPATFPTSITFTQTS